MELMENRFFFQVFVIMLEQMCDQKLMGLLLLLFFFFVTDHLPLFFFKENKLFFFGVCDVSVQPIGFDCHSITEFDLLTIDCLVSFFQRFRHSLTLSIVVK